jgi:hypothetical protein
MSVSGEVNKKQSNSRYRSCQDERKIYEEKKAERNFFTDTEIYEKDEEKNFSPGQREQLSTAII